MQHKCVLSSVLLRHSHLKPEAVLEKRLGILCLGLVSWDFLSDVMTTQSGYLKSYLVIVAPTQSNKFGLAPLQKRASFCTMRSAFQHSPAPTYS